MDEYQNGQQPGVCQTIIQGEADPDAFHGTAVYDIIDAVPLRDPRDGDENFLSDMKGTRLNPLKAV